MKSASDNLSSDSSIEKATLPPEYWMALIEATQACFTLRLTLLNEIIHAPLKKITKETISIYLDNVLENIKTDPASPSVKIILTLKENQYFLQQIKHGIIELYNSVSDKDKVSNKTLFDAAAPEVTNSKAVKTLITFLLEEESFTSPEFMKSNNIDLVSNISEVTENNTLYGYLYGAHWFLVFSDKGMFNVINIERSYGEITEKSFMTDHNSLKSLIKYTSINLQPAVEEVIGYKSTCGKVCIAIHEHLNAKQGLITLEDFQVIENSFKADYNLCNSFTQRVLALVREDSKIKYSINENYMIYQEDKSGSWPEPNLVEHDKFNKTLEYRENSYNINWDIIKYIVAGITFLTSLYLAYSAFSTDSPNVDGDSLEQILSGENWTDNYPKDL